jgi:ABC-type transport system involved in multi-copper enzyme maturation permease subunit
MWVFFLSSWRAGLRSRSIQAILLCGLMLVGIAFLAAFFSPRQPKTVALDVGLSGLRFSLVLLALFWVHELVGREIERRTILFALAYPVPRSRYILGRFAGILALLLLATAILGGLLYVAVLLSGPADYQQRYSVTLGSAYWLALFGLWLDVVVVSAFALWVASLSTVTVMPIATGVLFAIGGKSLGAVMDYLARGADGQDELVAAYSPLLDKIQWVLPDLSRLDWRVGAMYGTAIDGKAWAVAMALTYVALLLSATVVSFSRREFN